MSIQSKQARIQTHGNTAAQVRKLPRRSIAAQAESCPARSAAAHEKLGWTLSTEVTVRRRGNSTQHWREERGERREEREISGR